MTIYIDDLRFLDFMETAQDILLNPGICPMNDLLLSLIEKLGVVPVSASLGDLVAFDSKSQIADYDRRLTSVIETPQYISVPV